MDGLLPGRVGLVRWEYDDPAAVHLAGILNEWRADAAAVGGAEHAPDYGQLLGLFAEALTCGPGDPRRGSPPCGWVTCLTTRRRCARARELLTGTPEFDGEDAHLARLRDAALAADSAPRSPP